MKQFKRIFGVIDTSTKLFVPMKAVSTKDSAPFAATIAKPVEDEFEFSDNDDDEAPIDQKEYGVNLDFMKTCALCEQQHPRKAMVNNVMWKHVLTLRLVEWNLN